MSTTVMKQALEAFKLIADETYDTWTNGAKAQRIAESMIPKIDQAIAELENQKPVAWIDSSGHPKHLSYMQGIREKQLYGELQPLYTAPPQRQPLTDEMKAQAKRAYPHDEKRELAFIDGWLSCENTQSIKEQP